MTSTKSLDLFGMYEDVFFETLRDQFQACKLAKLDINVCIPVTNHMVACLANCLGSGRLNEFCLGGDFSETGNAATLASGLSRARHLRRLRLIWVDLEQNGLEAICNGLITGAGIKELDIRRTAILSKNETAGIGALLSSSTCGIEHLEMWQGQMLNTTVAAAALSHLAESMSAPNKSLKKIVLSRWGLNDTSLPPLGDFLQRFPSLVSLELPENRFSDFSSLATGWKHAGGLENINVSHNLIRESRGLAFLLGRMPGLKTLSLRSASMQVLEPVVDAMQSHHHKLEEIDYFNLDRSTRRRTTENKMAFLLSINLAGRRNERLENLESGLWPHLLERAGKLPYDKSCRFLDFPDDHTKLRFRGKMGASAIYSMLQSHVGTIV